jgi:hypothetical protein
MLHSREALACLFLLDGMAGELHKNSILRGLNIRETAFHVKQKSTLGLFPAGLIYWVCAEFLSLPPFSILKESFSNYFYSVIAYSLMRAKHHAQRGVDGALSDGSAVRHCNNIRPRNSFGATAQREDQEHGCSPVGSFPSGSV